jgi:hypothetical protein
LSVWMVTRDGEKDRMVLVSGGGDGGVCGWWNLDWVELRDGEYYLLMKWECDYIDDLIPVYFF